MALVVRGATCFNIFGCFFLADLFNAPTPAGKGPRAVASARSSSKSTSDGPGDSATCDCCSCFSVDCIHGREKSQSLNLDGGVVTISPNSSAAGSTLGLLSIGTIARASFETSEMGDTEETPRGLWFASNCNIFNWTSIAARCPGVAFDVSVCALAVRMSLDVWIPNLVLVCSCACNWMCVICAPQRCL